MGTIFENINPSGMYMSPSQFQPDLDIMSNIDLKFSLCALVLGSFTVFKHDTSTLWVVHKWGFPVFSTNKTD